MASTGLTRPPNKIKDSFVTILIQQILNGVVVGSGYVLVALGLTLIFGVLGLPNLAHGETYMGGAFVTYTLVSVVGWNYWVAIPVGMAAGAAIGIIVYEVAFRPLEKAAEVTLFISALAVATILGQLAVLIFGTGSRVIGTPVEGIVRLGGVTVTKFSIVILALVLVATVLLWMILHRTWFGRSMRALSQNRMAAELMGVNVRVVAYGTFALGSAVAALAGGVLGGIFPIFPTMGLEPVMKAFIVIVLGGVGSIPGVVVGGLLLGIVESLGAGYLSSDYRDPIAFGILVFVLALWPTGLARGKVS